MPCTCIVVGCGSRSNRDLVSFHSVPAVLNHRFLTQSNLLSKERRDKWLAAINRSDLTDSKIKYQKVCSKHFITGKPAALEDTNNPDWIPTLCMGLESPIVSKPGNDVASNKRVKKMKILEVDQPAVTPMAGARKSNIVCSVVGCHNSYNNTDPSIRFYSFPGKWYEKERRKVWVQKVGRITSDKKPWVPKRHDKVCSAHFVGNVKSDDSGSPSYYPTIFPKQYPTADSSNPSLKLQRFLRYKNRTIKKVTTSFTRKKSRPSESATQNTIQGNSSHSEQLHIKEEPLEADPSDYRLYQQLRNSIKTEPDNSETDSANSEIEKHIHSISTDKEHFVNVKKEYSDSCENEISVNHETEQIPMFESVFVKEEPFEEDCSL